MSYADRAVCVTGGAGFIGSHLCDALLQRGSEVRAFDDLSTGLRSNLGDGITLIEGSILDEAALARAFDGCAVVFHQAARTSVPGSLVDPGAYHEANATGTLRVLEAARRAGVGRVVLASSSSVYGDQPVSPKVETMCPDPLSPYAAAKAAAEQIARAYSCCYDLPCVCLRYFNIFGPRQRPDSPYAAVVPLFVTALGRGETVTIYGDGQQTRDFTHVSNAVQANLLAGVTDAPLRGQPINIATGHGRSVLEVLQFIGTELGLEARFELKPPRNGEIRHSVADITAAKRLLGYEPVKTFEDGLRETVGAYA